MRPQSCTGPFNYYIFHKVPISYCFLLFFMIWSEYIWEHQEHPQKPHFANPCVLISLTVGDNMMPWWDQHGGKPYHREDVDRDRIIAIYSQRTEVSFSARNNTRIRWRRVKTLSQHQVGVNLQKYAQHKPWISTWHIFHEFHKIMPG